MPLMALAACAFGPFAPARGEPLQDEDAFLREVPVVLSASRLQQPISETPVTMSVLDRAQIEASGLRSIADLFRLVPGMYVRPGVALEGVVPVVSYHGMTGAYSRRMQVLIDGRSVYLPPFSTVLWDDLPIAIDDIERIEITRGPNSASYGANAFFGTINIVTRAPLAGAGAYGLVRAGAQGVREGVARYEGGAGGASYRVTAGHKADAGFPALYDAQHHDYVSGRLEAPLGLNDNLQVQAGYSGGRRQLGFASDPINQPRTEGVSDLYLQAKWQRATTPGDELSLQYFFEQRGVDEMVATVPLPLPGQPVRAWSIDANSRFDRQDLELQQTLDLSAHARWVWGAGARVDGVAAPLYFDGRTGISSNLQRMFSHLEYRLTPDVLLQGGGMLERTSIAGTDFSPRLSLNYHVDENQWLRASWSSATRTPSLFESQGDFGVSFGPLRFPIEHSGGGLQSEGLTSLEAGYHGNFVARGLQLDVKVYRDYARQLIDEEPDLAQAHLNPIYPVLKLANLEDARVKGVEVDLHSEPVPGTRVLLAYADTRIVADQPAYTSSLARTMPRQVLSLLLDQHLGGPWTASGALYYNSSLPGQYGVAGQADQAPVGTGRRIDLRLVREADFAGHRGRIAVGVEDAFVGFVEFRPETTFTRRAYVELSAQL